MHKFSRLTVTHSVLLGLVFGLTAFVLWSSVSASTKLQNLIVLVPVCLVIAFCILCILWSVYQTPKQAQTTSSDNADIGAGSPVWGDVFLLAGFAIFCLSLTMFGFDLATFLFVWAGVMMSGGKGLWQPPLYAAIFTVAITYGFGSLFPYPMKLLVL